MVQANTNCASTFRMSLVCLLYHCVVKNRLHCSQLVSTIHKHKQHMTSFKDKPRAVTISFRYFTLAYLLLSSNRRRVCSPFSRRIKRRPSGCKRSDLCIVHLYYVGTTEKLFFYVKFCSAPSNRKLGPYDIHHSIQSHVI